MSIVEIFPTPLGIFNLKKNLNKEQLNFINEQKIKSKRSFGNNISKDNYVLDNSILFNLKKDIEFKVK
jgi:hypothetical protein